MGKAESKPDEQTMDKVDLFVNHTYEFDFPEDGLLKWDDWIQINPNYDPSVLTLEDDEVVNVNEDLLSEDIPTVNTDSSQNYEFRQSIKDLMVRLSASAFLWDSDENDGKNAADNTTVDGQNNENNSPTTSGQ